MKLSESEFTVGDRVRVVIEGNVKHVYSKTNVEIETDSGELLDLYQDEITSIEKLVQTFGPGDLVRHKIYRDHTYFLLPNQQYYSSQINEIRVQPEPFTSEGYDLLASAGVKTDD